MVRAQVFITVFLLSSFNLAAQVIRVSGVINDLETGEPIPYSTIEVFNDSLLIGGTSADSLGVFRLSIKKDWTHVRVSFIGYKSLQKLESAFKTQDYLTFALSRSTEWLEEVIVRDQKTKTELKIDRKVINLNSDIQNAGVSALEAFDHISEVEVDLANNRISLRGNDNVQILVNGKPNALSGAEILNQINASAIDRIEIITSPSVKYRSNGISGIINVILNKENGLGLNAKTYVATGTRRYSFGMSANYSTSKINYRLSASRAYRKETNNQTIARQFDTGLTERIFTPYQLRGGVNKIAVGIDVFLKDKHELSFGIDYTDDDHTYNNESLFSDSSGLLVSTYLRDNEHLHSIGLFDANYRLTFNKPLHFVEFDYQINFNKNSYPFEDYLDNVLFQTQFLTEDFTIQSIAIDHSLPVSKGHRIESGLFYNTQVLASTLDRITMDSAQKDQFDYNETVKGAYVLYHLPLGAWQIQAGLRFEQFKSRSQIISDDSGRSRSFNNLIPSVHLSHRFDDYHTFTLGYSQRIERPNFHHTNAFQLVSPLFDWLYNPDIIPETSHNIDGSFQKYGEKWDVGITGFYRQRNDVILWTALTEESRQVFRYENSGRFHSYGLELVLNNQLLSFWETSLSANYYLHRVHERVDVTWEKNYSSRVHLKNTFHFGKKLTTDLTYIQIPKRQTPFTVVRSRSRFDLAFNGVFANDRLTLSLRLVDLFNQNVIKRQSRTVGLLQQTEWDFQYQTRNFLINVNYKLFDKKVRLRKEKSRQYNKPLID